MNIVHVTPFFNPADQFGGPVTVLSEICQRQAARGHQVSVVTTALGLPPGVPQQQWVPISGYRCWYARLGPLSYLAPHMTPAMGAALAEAVPVADVLHLSVAFTHGNVLARQAARRYQRPYLLTPHGIYGSHFLDQRRLAKRAFALMYENRVIRDAAFLQALSPEDAEACQRFGAPPHKVRVIPNGVDLAAKADPALCRQAFGLQPEHRHLLFLARLHPIKGLVLLVQAFADAVAAGLGQEWQLLVAGADAGAQGEAEQLAQALGLAPRVRFLGLVQGDLKASLLHTVDLFALPSKAEGLSMSVLEACAARVPVLISDRCNLPEIQPAGAGAVLPLEAAAFAAALLRYGADEPLRQRSGQAALHLVQRRYSWDTVVDQLDALYHEMRTGRPAGRTSKAAASRAHPA